MWRAELGAYLAGHGGEGAAVDELVESLRLDPRDAHALSTLGQLLASWYEPESHDAAAAAFRVVLALEPRNPDPWAMLGLYEESRGNVTDAIALIMMAAVLQPTDPTYYRRLADLWHLREGDPTAEEHAEAYASLSKALSPSEGPPHGMKELLGEFPTSPEDTRRHRRVVLLLAQAWMDVREADDVRLGEALVALDDLARGDLADSLPEASLPPYELGRLHRQVGDHEHLKLAIQYLEEASKCELPGGLDIPGPWLLDLADTYSDAERYEQAIEQYTATLQLAPERLSIETNRGRHAPKCEGKPTALGYKRAPSPGGATRV